MIYQCPSPKCKCRFTHCFSMTGPTKCPACGERMASALVGRLVVVQVPKDFQDTEVTVLECIPPEDDSDCDELRVKRCDNGFEFVVEAFRVVKS